MSCLEDVVKLIFDTSFKKYWKIEISKKAAFNK
jgi:hypothetical protein